MSKHLLDQAIDTIKEYEAAFDRLKSMPLFISTVVKVDKKEGRVLLTTADSDYVCVGYPEFDIKPGMQVNVNPQTSQIVNMTDFNSPTKVVTVNRIIDNLHAFITIGGEDNNVAVIANDLALKEGDEVYVDPRARVILGVFKAKVETANTSIDSVTWDSIAGLDDVKYQLREMVEMPLTHSEIFKSYGYTPPKGVLLSGPPGCGKTLLGKATANSIKTHFGKTSEDGFIYIKGPEVLNKYVGESEAHIRKLFTRARKHKEKTGSPAVIFIDEADALLGSRNGSGKQSLSGMEKTIVPAFLAEMDGIGEHSAFVIIATNRPETLDSAIVRDGRIDRKVRVTRPSVKMIDEIAQMNLKETPLGEAIPDTFVSDEVSKDENAVYVVQSHDKEYRMTLRDMMSGAMVANIARRAKSIALKRDIESHKKTATGIFKNDLVQAVKDVRSELKNLDHREEIKDFCDHHSITDSKVYSLI